MTPYCRLLCIAVFGIVFGARTSSAIVIDYGSFETDWISVLNVVENAPNETTSLFGNPDVSVATLRFQPSEFITFGDNGDSGTRNSTLSFEILAAAPYTIESVHFSEYGNMTLLGSGTDATSVGFTGSGQVMIQEVDGLPIAPFAVPFSFNDTLAPWQLGSDGQFIERQWTSGLSVELHNQLASRDIPFMSGITKVGILLDNQITAHSEAGTIAATSVSDVLISPGLFDHTPGVSQFSPMLPSSIGPNGEYVFQFEGDGYRGLWIDPALATGYRFDIEGGLFTLVAPPDDPSPIDDDDDTYILESANGTFGLAPWKEFPYSIHDFESNGGRVSSFTISGISVSGSGLDAANPGAFPTFVQFHFDAPTVTIIMTPIPEPATIFIFLVSFLRFSAKRFIRQ